MPVIRKQAWVGLLVAAVVLSTTVILASSVMAYLDRGLIPPGISVCGVAIGSLKYDKAESVLKAELPRHLGSNLEFFTAEDKVALPLSKYGIIPDYQAILDKTRDQEKDGIAFHAAVRGGNLSINPVLHWNTDNFSEIILDLKSKVDRPPRDAKAVFRNHALEYIAPQDGATVDEAETKANLESSLQKGRITGIPIELKPVAPHIKFEDVKNIKDIMSVNVTLFKPSQTNRTYNMAKAAAAIDGTVILPGEVFSFDRSLGPRTKENGYREASVIVNNRIQNDMGGGICQVATTLYDAAVQAGLDIVERKAHSQPITYAQPGLDATIAADLSDLKFKNSTAHPIMLSVQLQENQVIARVFGTNVDPRRKIELITEKQEVPQKVIVKYDSTLPQGSRVVKSQGRSGYRVKTYRVVSEGGKEIEKKLLSQDEYQGEPMLILVGSSTTVSAIK
jgi:vancomycin resistance protein YoaR